MIATAATQPIHVFRLVDMDRDGRNVSPGLRDPVFLLPLSRGLLHAATEPTGLTLRVHIVSAKRLEIHEAANDDNHCLTAQTLQGETFSPN